MRHHLNCFACAVLGSVFIAMSLAFSEDSEREGVSENYAKVAKTPEVSRRLPSYLRHSKAVLLGPKPDQILCLLRKSKGCKRQREMAEKVRKTEEKGLVQFLCNTVKSVVLETKYCWVLRFCNEVAFLDLYLISSSWKWPLSSFPFSLTLSLFLVILVFPFAFNS